MHDDAPPGEAGGTNGAPRRPAGALEAEVMTVLQESDVPLSPGQVQQRLAARQRAELSYSTVVTIMSRLHAKGLLARERAGRGFIYKPVDAALLAANQMGRALDAGPSHDAVLARFASGLSRRDARLLRQLLADPGDRD